MSVGSPATARASSTRLLTAARSLHAYLVRRHLENGRLEGPDQGVRWNIRVWRFAKSYAPLLFPRERHFFLQGQSYWALANWGLEDLTGETSFGGHAASAVEAILAAQRPDGAWNYPLPERRHLIATVEGDFAAIALLEAHRRGVSRAALEAATLWHDYVEARIGYQHHPSGLAVNYFQLPRGMVPNNTAEWIWVLGRFAAATGERRYLERVPALLGFLEAVMLPSGELPYELAGSADLARTRIHYLCYQYNAFQCMKLAWYAREHGDARARALAIRLAGFLATGVKPSGAARASCSSDLPEVVYYADAVGLALHTVTELGWADHREASDRAFRWVLSRQRPDGGFHFSRGDYHVLSDRGSYPRYLATTLYHLTERARSTPEP